MYKKHSKFFNRSSRIIAGTEGASPSLAKAGKQRELRRERAMFRSDFRKCEKCGDPIYWEFVADHQFRIHDRDRCKYCKEFIAVKKFADHMRSVHGLRLYHQWRLSLGKTHDRKDRQHKTS